MTSSFSFLALNSQSRRRGSSLCCAVLMMCSALAVAESSAKKTIEKIDASVATRDENLLGYTVTEQYRVYRGSDRVHPAAEMTVKTTYRKDAGKSYVILTQSGSELLLKEVLGRVLDSERLMTQPANRAQAVLTTENYNMTVKGEEMVNGRACDVVVIMPKRSSPYLFNGKIWVDALDGSIVKLQGVASKSASVLTGAAQVSRQYVNINGIPMATNATAVAASWILGQTTIDIEYTGYQMNLSNSTGALQTAGHADPRE
jgi:outer membrane lipoprotein-sorting protein